MQKIIYLKDYQNHKKGEVEIVSNNVAHGLIEQGVANLFGYQAEALFKPPVDKMMRTTRRKTKGRYSTK